MKYTNKTEYGIVCMLYMIQAAPKRVSIHQMARKERYPAAFIHKVLQSLRAAGLVKSHAGKQGGYSLSRPPEKITLRDVIEAIEGETFETLCESPRRGEIVCNHFCACNLKPVWQKTKRILDKFYDSITLASLGRARR